MVVAAEVALVKEDNEVSVLSSKEVLLVADEDLLPR